MSSIDRTTAAPPRAPVETNPPGPADIALRTERADFIFVNYLGTHHGLALNEPSEHRVADVGFVPSAVAAVLARDEARTVYPLVWLAAGLGPAFEAAYVPAKLAAERARLGGDPAAWDAPVDLAPLAAATAAVHAAWKDPAYQAAEEEAIGARDAALRAGGWAPGTKPSPALAEAGEAAWRAAMARAGQLAADDAYTAALNGMSPDPAVARWLSDQYCDADEGYFAAAPKATTAARTLEENVRAEAHGRLEPFDRWHILLGARGSDRYEVAGLGAAMYPARVVQALDRRLRDMEERHALPVAAGRLYGFMREWHERRDDGCEWVPGLGCAHYPSPQAVAKWMKEGGVTDPAAPTAPPPPTAAALLAGRGTLRGPAPLLAYLAWPGRTTMYAAREKDGKSTLLGGAAAALTRGTPWLGAPTAAAASVLWYHEEAEDDVIARLQRFGADLARVHLRRLPLAGPEVLAADVAAVRPALAVVDTLIRYQGGLVTQDTSAVQWERVLTPLNTAAHAPGGPAIVVLHHAGKAGGEYRDSTEIGAFCDLIVEQRSRLKDNRQTLEARPRITGVEPYAVTVELRGDAHALVTGAATRPEDLTDGERQALDALRRLHAETGADVPNAEWEEAAGLPPASYTRHRETLVERGLVARTGEKGKPGQTFRPA